MKDFFITIGLLAAGSLFIYLACLRKTIHDTQVSEYDDGDAARAHCICGWTRVHYGGQAKEDAERAAREHIQQVCQ